MKKMKTTLSLIICACMLGVMPGFDCYQAAAIVVQTQVQAVPANAGVGAAGASLSGSARLAASPSAGIPGASLVGILLPNGPSPQINAAAVQAAAAGVLSPVAVQTVLPKSAATPIILHEAVIPGLSLNPALQQAEPVQAQAGIVRSALGQLQKMVLSFTKKGGRGSRGMPDYDGGSDDHISDPDGSGSGIDPLGNPSRDPNRDTGPDSRDSGDSWDRDSGGGSMPLFKGSRASRGMPDYDRGSSDNTPDPDGSGSGIDPLGNPSRDPNRDTGPDSRDSGDSWDRDSGGGSMPLFKGSRASRGMPDYDRGSSDNTPDPDGSGSGIDPLGNPSRDPNRDTGPDSRDSGDSWDGGGRSGGSELFKSPVTGLGAGLQLFAPAAAPADTKAAPVSLDNRPVDLVVMFGETPRTLTRDEHLANVDVNSRGGVSLYAFAQQRITAQLGAVGLEADTMAAYNATPIATYARINAATIRVEAGRADEFRRLLEGRGFKVYDNARRHIVEPVPVRPEDMDPVGRGAVTMEEDLKISKADTVQALAQKAWGAPALGFLGRLIMKVLGAAIPQPPMGIIDTGADTNHPLLRNVRMVNATSGPSVDDNGHGSWVTSKFLSFAKWLKSLTHYKVFTADGGATLDDILKALTMAGNDGNLVISNSWGDDQGDPEGPDSQLVRKLAMEGHVMVFAGG
ncbi:MAG: S8 family serine peptidase, partial [Elusimicrobia bacterium]|nr:S8 family serine peptidase [Elusimicrobiota bacterium]